MITQKLRDVPTYPYLNVKIINGPTDKLFGIHVLRTRLEDGLSTNQTRRCFLMTDSFENSHKHNTECLH